VAVAHHPDIFAANRATGRIALAVKAQGGVTRRSRVHEAGSLRVRFPNVTSEALEAVIVNTGGGMTGGDCFSIAIAVGEGARLVAGTAAARPIDTSVVASNLFMNHLLRCEFVFPIPCAAGHTLKRSDTPLRLPPATMARAKSKANARQPKTVTHQGSAKTYSVSRKFMVRI